MLFHNVYHWTFVLWCETVQGCLCDGFIWPGSGFAAAYRQCSLELKDWMGQWSQQVWHGVAFFSRQHINHVLIIYNSINIVIWWIIYGKLVWSYLCLLKWVAISHHLSSFVIICHESLHLSLLDALVCLLAVGAQNCRSLLMGRPMGEFKPSAACRLLVKKDQELWKNISTNVPRTLGLNKG